MDLPLLLDQLSRYHAFDAAEESMRLRLMEFVRETPGCFERATPQGHLTGSAWILDREHTHVLLTHHLKLDRWLQPGGHTEDDASMFDAALREAHEESGLDDVVPLGRKIWDIDIHEIPARGADPAHLHYDVRYLFEADRAAPLVVSSESRELAWVALEKVARLNGEASIERMVTKTRVWIKGLTAS